MVMTLPHFNGKAFLAPMAGVSDPAMRLLCKELGAALVVTELTSVHAIVAKERILAQDGKAISEFVEYSDKERPVSIQLFGCDIPKLAKSAEIVSPFFDVIDYNMGCPAPHITKQMAGAALLQKPELTQKIFETLVKHSDKPVTLKMRSGVRNSNQQLFTTIAKQAEDCGIEMVTLHARTIQQGYSGKADWKLIKQLKELVNIPVVGNGDIFHPQDAIDMMNQTGCDYVMVGRGARNNPFIFQQINELVNTGTFTPISDEIRVKSFFTYLDYSKNYTIPFPRIRAMAMQFTKGVRGGTKIREGIGKAQTQDELRKLFEKNITW